jgi:ureidoglycolate dehydrogenase (NAD+)
LSERPRYAAAALYAYCVEALRQAGASAADAAVCAESLVAADLRGVHSHGTLRTGIYIDRLRAGSIDPGARLVPVHDLGAVVVADAQHGLGVAMAVRAMDLAVERARAHGVGVVGVRNGNHCGMLAHLVLRASRAGLIALAMSNADAQVAPWGARAKFMGTDPFAAALPSDTDCPLVLDFATSVVAHAKIKGAADRGETIPPDWAVDRDGRPTTDPHQALAGALLAFGGAKGSGLAILIEVLAGLLPGGRVGPEIVPLYQRLHEPQGAGHLFLVLRVDAFGPPQPFVRRVDETMDRIRALPAAAGVSRPMLPGEPERERERAYGRDGIPLPADAVAELHRTAALLGIAAPSPMRGSAKP